MMRAQLIFTMLLGWFLVAAVALSGCYEPDQMNQWKSIQHFEARK